MPVEGGSFFDTNVLLYLVSSESEKARMLDRYMMGGGKISVQVLNEITNVARKKYGFTIEQIRPFLLTLRAAFQVVPVTLELHEIGLDLIGRYQFSTYDAMIVAAALHSGCNVVLSEDMQNGMSIYGRLRIQNPFLH